MALSLLLVALAALLVALLGVAAVGVEATHAADGASAKAAARRRHAVHAHTAKVTAAHAKARKSAVAVHKAAAHHRATRAKATKAAAAAAKAHHTSAAAAAAARAHAKQHGHAVSRAHAHAHTNAHATKHTSGGRRQTTVSGARAAKASKDSARGWINHEHAHKFPRHVPVDHPTPSANTARSGAGGGDADGGANGALLPDLFASDADRDGGALEAAANTAIGGAVAGARAPPQQRQQQQQQQQQPRHSPAVEALLADALPGAVWYGDLDVNAPISVRPAPQHVVLDGGATQLDWLNFKVLPFLAGSAAYLSLTCGSKELQCYVPAEVRNALRQHALAGVPPDSVQRVVGLHFENRAFDGFISDDVKHLALQQLLLLNVGLRGTLPAPALTSLALSLQHLDLSSNHISGTLPTELGHLRELRTLNVDHNQLSGTIPTELGLLTNLESLRLDANALGGYLPSEVVALTAHRLRYIFVEGNDLRGTLPAELERLPKHATCRFGGGVVSKSGDALLPRHKPPKRRHGAPPPPPPVAINCWSCHAAGPHLERNAQRDAKRIDQALTRRCLSHCNQGACPDEEAWRRRHGVDQFAWRVPTLRPTPAPVEPIYHAVDVLDADGTPGAAAGASDPWAAFVEPTPRPPPPPPTPQPTYPTPQPTPPPPTPSPTVPPPTPAPTSDSAWVRAHEVRAAPVAAGAAHAQVTEQHADDSEQEQYTDEEAYDEEYDDGEGEYEVELTASDYVSDSDDGAAGGADEAVSDGDAILAAARVDYDDEMLHG